MKILDYICDMCKSIRFPIFSLGRSVFKMFLDDLYKIYKELRKKIKK